MISIYQLKPRFQKLLQPFTQSLFKWGVTANEVTIAAIVLSFILGLLLAFYSLIPLTLLLVPIGLLGRMALNALDGMMARQFQMQSQQGEMLNEIGDVASDLFIILPLLMIPTANVAIIVTFALLTLLNEFVGVLGKVVSGERRYDGPMGKSDRALLIGLFCLVYYCWNGLEIYINWIFGIACCLLVLSTYNRYANALKTTRNVSK